MEPENDEKGGVRVRKPTLLTIRLRAIPCYLGGHWRESLWIRPMLGGVVALALLPVVAWLDHHPQATLSRLIPQWLVFQGTTEEGRELLSTIVPMTLTGASLLLALSLLLLRMAADEFSPRLLTAFMRSWSMQLTLAVLVALGVFNLAEMHWINTGPARFDTVPRLGISVGVLLGLLGLVMLITFLNQLAHWLQTDYIITQIGSKTYASIARLPPGVGRAAGGQRCAPPPEDAMPVYARTSGYIKARWPRLLLSAAAADDVMVRLEACAGDYVVAGITPLARVWYADHRRQVPSSHWRAIVQRAVAIGDERSYEHDVDHGLRQLVDIPCRVLYPRGKDPYTAVQAINWLSTLLCGLATRPLGNEALHDRRGRMRVIVAAPSFGDYLDAVCGPLRRLSGYDPSVRRALARMLDQVRIAAAEDSRRDALVCEQKRLLCVNADQAVEAIDSPWLNPAAAGRSGQRRRILRGFRDWLDKKEVRMRPQWRLWRERMRESLLVLPLLAIAVAVVLAALLSQVRIEPTPEWEGWLFGGSATEARETLTTIAFVIFNGTTLMFALTIVVFKVIAIQFSPRLLNNILGDRGLHLVFAAAFLFFVYPMGVMFWMRVEAGDYPRLAVTVGALLVFLALAALIFMINRLAQWVRLATVTADAGRRAAAVIARRPIGIGREAGLADNLSTGESVPRRAIALPAPRSGYILDVQPRPLLLEAERLDAVIHITPSVGDYVVAGVTPLAWVWPRAEDAEMAQLDCGPLEQALSVAVSIDFERVMTHDVAFGIQQLVDTALRANNPPGKDPYTVVQCIHWLRLVLIELSRLPLGDEMLCDDKGSPRLTLSARDYGDYIDLACDDIRRYGLVDTMVVFALLQLLEEMATVVADDDRRHCLATHLQRVLSAIDQRFHEPADTQPIRDRVEKLRAMLNVETPPPGAQQAPEG